jgi:NAD(P)-dependent dehydrogenase (short-subunit alcohol dehydrogenase family)
MTTKTLADRTAIVTGAGQGIGRAIAAAMGDAGAAVVLVDRAADTVNEVARDLRSAGARVAVVEGSVADRATADRAVAAAVDDFGRLDAVVNCAQGYTPHAAMDTIPVDDFRHELDTGFFGTVHLMQAAFPALRERGGSIVNFGSVVALEGSAKRATYAAAKEAIRGMSRAPRRAIGGPTTSASTPSAHRP